MTDSILKKKFNEHGIPLEENKFVQKKIRFSSVGKKIVSFLVSLSKMGISIGELITYPIFPTHPYMIPETKDFLVKVNIGELKEVKRFLEENRYLAFQIDSVGRTGLHRAARKCNVKMVKLILKYRPDINCCDFFGKSALSYAIENNDFDSARELLIAKISPWSDRNSGYKQQCVSPLMEKLISKVRKFSIGLHFCKNRKERIQMWEYLREGLEDVENPFFNVESSED